MALKRINKELADLGRYVNKNPASPFAVSRDTAKASFRRNVQWWGRSWRGLRRRRRFRCRTSRRLDRSRRCQRCVPDYDVESYANVLLFAAIRPPLALLALRVKILYG